MSKIEREAVAFVEARRAELDTVEKSRLSGCEFRIPYEPETGDGFDSCIQESLDREDWCDACVTARAAYTELPAIRSRRRNSWRRLERAVNAEEKG